MEKAEQKDGRLAAPLMTVTSEPAKLGPRQFDLDRCVHCGLCLNACPTYRELGLEMDSPRGRIYQMVQVAEGAPITDAYREHIALCLACRGCESACPSGVRYGRMVGMRARSWRHRRSADGWRGRCGISCFRDCCNRARGSLWQAPCCIFLSAAA